MTSVEVEGVRLAYLEHGRGPAVLVLHGFTGSALSMAVATDALARDHRVVACDLIGHGDSDAPADPARYSTDATVRQIGVLLDLLDIDDVALVGYSFGGRLALSFAVTYPERVRSLALIGTTAGIEDDRLRADRREADAALADRIERDGVERFVDYWEALPIFATQRALPAAVRAGIRRTRTDQRPIGLANSLRGAGAGSMPQLWAEVGLLDVPTLLVVGELDERYVEIGRRLAAVMPAARLQVMAGVGHAAHLEAPVEVADAISGFIR